MRLFAAWALLVCLTSARASSDELDTRSAARASFHEGTERYYARQYRAALDSFQRAYALHADPAFLFNLAQCYRQLDEEELAIRYYDLYLAQVPAAPNRAEVKRWIGELIERKLRREIEEPATVAKSPALVSPPIVAPPPTRPLWRRWWLWAGLGALVAAGAAIGITLAATAATHFDATLPPIGPAAALVAW